MHRDVKPHNVRPSSSPEASTICSGGFDIALLLFVGFVQPPCPCHLLSGGPAGLSQAVELSAFMSSQFMSWQRLSVDVVLPDASRAQSLTRYSLGCRS